MILKNQSVLIFRVEGSAEWRWPINDHLEISMASELRNIQKKDKTPSLGFHQRKNVAHYRAPTSG